MQAPGRRFAVAHVHNRADDAAAELRMDLAPAYPAKARIKTWMRTVQLDRRLGVEVQESFELEEISGATSLNLLTPMQVELSKPGLIRLTGPLRVTIEYDGGKLKPAVDRIPLEDESLRKVWGSALQRIRLQAASPALKETWRLKLRRE